MANNGVVEPEAIWLVGTNYISDESAADVDRVIREVMPDNVVVELCRSRYCQTKMSSRKSLGDYAVSYKTTSAVSAANLKSSIISGGGGGDGLKNSSIGKGLIARGTFGTFHRGIYDGQDVAEI